MCRFNAESVIALGCQCQLTSRFEIKRESDLVLEISRNAHPTPVRLHDVSFIVLPRQKNVRVSYHLIPERTIFVSRDKF